MKKHITKGIILLTFVSIAIYFFQFSSLSESINRDSLRIFIDGFGVWAPLVYIITYAVGICLFIPGTPLTAAGGIIFGLFWGFIYTIIVAMIGSIGSFWIARYLGKDAVSHLIKGLDKYQKFLEKEGFTAVLYMRLLYIPFTPSNFAYGLVNIKFKDFFWGTFFGILPGTFIFTFFFDTISSITSFSDLIQWKIGFALVLFVGSFFIPVVAKKLKNSRNFSKSI